MRVKSLIFLLICALSGLSQKINTSLVYSVQPSARPGKSPVLIVMHGYGANEADLLDVAREVGNNFTIFSLRGPNITPNGGFCWYKLEFLPNGEFKYDYNEVVKSRQLVASFISNACRVYGLDSSNVYLMGFSQGAIMGYDLSLSNPQKIKGVIAMSGRLMKESRLHASNQNTLKQLRFFVGHGTEDGVIKFEESKKAVDFLKNERKIIAVDHHTYQMEHRISVQEIADIKRWLTDKVK